MSKNISSKILITGGSGMVGKSMADIIANNNYGYEWIFLSSKDCDLTNYEDVDILFNKIKPKYVIHLAANIGGLFKNMREKTKMFKDNILMNENVLSACNKYNVEKGIFCLSSCIYPHNPSKYPMNESMIHESEPHPSNESYGYAKRMMELQCRNYNIEFGRNYICLMPVNLYGPYDNFHLTDSHVIAGMIHRFYNAKKENTKFEMYGTGTPLRQFIYTPDFVKIIIKTLFEHTNIKPINCCNDEISIKDLTYLIGNLSNYDTQNIIRDVTKNDGCLKKTISNDYFKSIFPDFEFVSLNDGISKTIKWFNENYDNCRK
jgi:GDP-L-fucose synthase